MILVEWEVAMQKYNNGVEFGLLKAIHNHYEFSRSHIIFIVGDKYIFLHVVITFQVNIALFQNNGQQTVNQTTCNC